jgi:hypothetical protein
MNWRLNGDVKSKAWTAIVVLLMQALLPAFIYATASKASGLFEVCTAFGIKTVSSPSSDPHGGIAHQQHCPICSVAQLLALPVKHAALNLPSVTVPTLLSFPDSQEYVVIWLSPYLRAPPLHA